MKICVIGNSHSGAIAEAWNAISGKWGNVDITFFAFPAMKAKQLVAKDGVLVARRQDARRMMRFSSGGLSKIVPGDYERILAYGMVKPPPADVSDIPLSAAVRDAAVADRASGSLATLVLSQIRKVSRIPVDVAPAPYIAANADDAPEWSRSDADELALMQGVFNRLEVRLIGQPLETMVSSKSRATLRRYSEGSSRLSTPARSKVGGVSHGDQEVRHMNRQYGEIWLRQYLSNLS